MEKLEKVELIREKCGVSYEDAKAALDACGDDTLDARPFLLPSRVQSHRLRVDNVWPCLGRTSRRGS